MVLILRLFHISSETKTKKYSWKIQKSAHFGRLPFCNKTVSHILSRIRFVFLRFWLSIKIWSSVYYSSAYLSHIFIFLIFPTNIQRILTPVLLISQVELGKYCNFQVPEVLEVPSTRRCKRHANSLLIKLKVFLPICHFIASTVPG